MTKKTKPESVSDSDLDAAVGASPPLYPNIGNTTPTNDDVENLVRAGGRLTGGTTSAGIPTDTVEGVMATRNDKALFGKSGATTALFEGSPSASNICQTLGNK